MSAGKTRRPRRYTVREVGAGSVELHVLADCWLGLPGQVRAFFVPADGGYVREWLDGGDARQVCNQLRHGGSTLRSSALCLVDDIRREAASLLREQQTRGGFYDGDDWERIVDAAAARRKAWHAAREAQ